MFVLRQGLKREHAGPIVLFCGGADGILIAAGAGGVGALLGAMPQLTLALTRGGAVFLAWYGFKALRRFSERWRLKPWLCRYEDGSLWAARWRARPRSRSSIRASIWIPFC